MKYVLTGAASILSLLGLTFSGFMVYGMCASWQASNISNPLSTKQSLAATQSSVGQSPSPVGKPDTASLPSSTAASAQSSSTSSPNAVTTSKKMGIGVRAWE